MSDYDFVYEKTVAEKERIGHDFTDRMSAGEILNSATYTVLDLNGVNVTAILMVTGSEQVVGNIASCRIQAGTNNTDYFLHIVGTTSASDVVEVIIRIEVRN